MLVPPGRARGTSTTAPFASVSGGRLSPAARALLGMLQSAGGTPTADRVHELSPQVRDETVELALRHGIAPLLHRALQSGGALAALPDEVRARLEEARRATALDNLRNYGEFRRIARALREQGISVIALKGLHLADLVYRDISLRPMSDLDILVPRSQAEHAIATLQRMEFDLKGGIPSGYDTVLIHRRLGIMVEVHWSLAQPTEPYAPPIADIWRMAVPAKLGDADTQVMSLEFLLLYVCAHLAYHHLFALDLRALCDIAQIAHARPALDWSVVVEQGRQHGWARGVAAALRLASEHAGADVPGEVLTALGADQLDPQLMQDALEQLATFAEYSFDLRVAPKLMSLKTPIGWQAKFATLWSRIFVPRAELALLYGIPERSARINLYYAIRLRDLIRRYAASVMEMNGSNAQIVASTARHARLAKWINGN